MMNEVKLIPAQATYSLRLRVLWPHLSKLEECALEVDDKKDTFHIGAYKNDAIVAIATFLVEKNEKLNKKKQYRLRAMATDPDVRGENFGKQVIDFAIEKLKKEGVDLLWCDARKVALGFYEKMNFKITGDFYEVRNIGPHKLMYYNLKE